MRNFLKEILEKKKEELPHLYRQYEHHVPTHRNHGFSQALKNTHLSLIAELKKASPSKGIINPQFNVIELANQYIHHGAKALSVLTEPHFFLGDPLFIPLVKKHFDIPILRKDFIIDAIQIKESVFLGADAILLIQACLSVNQTQQLINEASRYHLDVLLEVHDQNELDMALSYTGLSIIGINNRNLNSFKIDISTASALKKAIPNSYMTVAESGYQHFEQLQQLTLEKFDAVLIGTGLVENKELISFFTKAS